MSIKCYFKNIFLFIILLSFTKSNVILENIILEDEQIIRHNLNENKYFYIEPKFKNSFPNYIKIMKKPEQIVEIEYINYINYAISYYQNDSFFENRKQYSHNAFNDTIMWLNKEQINKGFYLSAECFITPCKYSFEISLEDFIYLGQQYKYYVTKDNMEMNFIIKDINNSIGINDTLTIWVKGNKEIFSNLNNGDFYYKYSENNINTYLIKFDNIINITNFFFEVKGKEGDMINVGSLLCKENQNPLCQIGLIYEGAGVVHSGFLKRNILENNCFSRELLKTEFFKFIDSHNEIIESYNIIDYFCIKIPEKYNEIFYSIIGYGYENKKPLGNKLYPIVPVVNHLLKIK